MKLERFELERIMSEWQNVVEIDLSSSGVDAMQFSDFISPEEFLEIYHTVKLRFIQTNGPIPLRESICRRYPASNVDNVLVTNGSSEALMIMLWKHCEPGFELVQITPTYSLVGGLARSLGATVKSVALSEQDGWNLDLDALENRVTASTKMIYVCNPNNPTGSILAEEEMAAVVRIAAEVGAWLVADEIYHGAELDGQRTRSFWGMYDKLLITSSLSKAYGLPGLRIGWLTGPPEEITQIWHYHDYTTTTTSAVSAKLAHLSLEPERESRILARAQAISQKNVAILENWLAQRPTFLSYVPTKIGGLAFFRYHLEMPSEELAMHLIQKQKLLLAPGDYFGADHHFRIGYSVPHLANGLASLGKAFDELAND